MERNKGNTVTTTTTEKGETFVVLFKLRVSRKLYKCIKYREPTNIKRKKRKIKIHSMEAEKLMKFQITTKH